MIQKNPGRNRMRTQLKSPSPSRIKREASRIRSDWSPTEKKQRRIDTEPRRGDSRFQAHLRFIQFLIDYEAGNIR